MVGYQDDKYFRKVFKKVEGITPNEYRLGLK
jgi:two-component system response regulator YesN